MQTVIQQFNVRYGKELTWFVPLLCIALATFSLLRSSPQMPIPVPGRIVTDAGGTAVHIAIPYRGTIFTWGVGGAPEEYLEVTHSPETMLYIGGNPESRAAFAKSVYGWVYPEVTKTSSLWNTRTLFQSSSSSEELEAEIARNGGAYLGSCTIGSLLLLRSVGQPALCLADHAKNWDETLFSEARVQAALVGQPERAEALIARYKQAYADLAQELRPATLPNHPRILITDIPCVGCGPFSNGPFYVKGAHNDYQIYLPPAGVVNASIGWSGERDDLERFLAMDPDYIFLMGNAQAETPQGFLHDPRWRGLKAVRDKQVYVIPGLPNSGGLAGLIFQPLWVRWMAEITHPDRLHPELRAVMRQTLLTEFNYRLSDDQIDALLRLQENSGSAGYARFTSNYSASAAPNSGASTNTISEPTP